MMFFFFKQNTAYEMRISDWSSDVCSSDLADLHQDLQVVLKAIGEGIGDHRQRRRPTRRRRDLPAHLLASLLDHHHDLANLRAHLRPSSPFMSCARNPPMRSWMRPPVVIVRMSTSSSASGAPGTPTSTALKCPRT